MLNETSFAIHPSNEMQQYVVKEQDIGDVKSVQMEANNVYQIICERSVVYLVFYREDIVRFVYHPFQKTCLSSSPALILEPQKVNVRLTETDKQAIFQSNKLTVKISKSPLRITIYNETDRILVKEGTHGIAFTENEEIICYKEMETADHFYGFGEKTGFLNKRGEKMTMWNTDVYAPHNPETDALYESIPYFMTVRDGFAHGIFFDNTYKSTFDFRSDHSTYSFRAKGGKMDYYVMAGPTPKDVLEQYTALTGRIPIPPKWSLGYHQSRYSYESEEEVRKLADIFKEKEIPLDVIHLDIHYMDGFRVFTFDKNRFPQPEKLIADLKENGIRVVPIVDPGVKEDPEYNIYQEGVRNDHFCKYIEGNIYYGDVWPGNSAFPDYTSTRVRKWWGEKHQFYTDIGVEGIWNDMNEPAIFNETKTMDVKVVHDNDGDPKTHRELHNIYGFMMGESTYCGLKKQLAGKRPFVLTRAGYAGVQRYAAVWTGDNRSFWEHLQMSLPMIMNLGLSGISFTGPDVGGFAHDSNGELLARWTQVGAFTPFFRNHSALGFVRQEPWSFGEPYEAIVKKYIELRYVWLPHLYSLFAEAHRIGTPVMRPLFIEFPNDKNTYNLSDQFMIGDNVIVAPIMQPKTMHRVAYFPEGNWVDYWTGKVFEGKKHHLIEASLDVLPIYVRQGTIVAHGGVKQSTNVQDEKLTLHLYYGEKTESVYSLYEDDGSTFSYEKGEYLLKTLIVRCENNTVHLNIENEGNYKPAWDLQLHVHGTNESLAIYVNDVEVVEKKRLEKLIQVSLSLGAEMN